MKYTEVRDQFFYTDRVHRITMDEVPLERILMITGVALYLLSPLGNFKVIKRLPLKQISGITISRNRLGLCAIHNNVYE